MFKKISTGFFILAISLSFLANFPFAKVTQSATLLTDDFTGTTINTSKWTEVDTGGAGGTTGNITQNGTLSTANGFAGSVWGSNALTSVDNFDPTDLEISAVMTRASDQLLGFGNYNFQSGGTKAYILDLVSGAPLALAWEGGNLRHNSTCGTYTAGATYKIKVISTGFEVYKDAVLACTQSVDLAYRITTDSPIFLQSSVAASTFDDVLVTGNSSAPTAPGAPTGLGATAGNTQVSLAWTAPASTGGSAITDYLVEYKLTSEPTTWSTFSDGTSTSTSATVTSLSNGSGYDFRVSAVNAIGTSTASGTASATPSAPTAPGAPTGLSGVSGNNQVSLSWTAPVSNGGSAITDYLVEYKLNSEPTTWTTFNDGTSTSTSATVTGLTNDLVYNFRVSTTNAIGTSSPSATANATPGVETPLTISNMSLWLDGSDTATITESSGIISQVNDKSGNGKNGTATGLVRPTLVSSVQNGRSIMRFDGGDDYLNINSSIAYRTVFVVAKYDSTSFGTYAGIVGDFTGTSPSNGHIVNGVDATNKIASATSNYTTAYRNGTAIAGSSGHSFAPLNEFWIGAFELPSSITNTTSAIGMINGGGRYWDGDIAEVIAYSTTLTNTQRAQVENYLSVKWGITVTGPSAPDAPTALGASKGNTQISLSWTAPDDGGSALTDYIVEYKLSSEPTTWTTFADGTSTSTTATVTGLTNDLSYNFRVKAVNEIGTSTASDTATKTPGLPTAPDSPTSVTAVEGNTQATITFTAPVDNGGASITSYTVTSSPGSFTGTTINTDKWNEFDPTGAGGTTGKIQQNGTLTIADSYAGVWGQNALISQDIFDATSLEISATMTAGSSPLIGYGDYDFGLSGKKAYLLYLTGAGTSILALSWDGASSSQTSCGNADAGAAVYKMKLISGGFEVYKAGVLMCTHNTAIVVNNKPIFLENSAAASTFDNIIVYGLSPIDTVPDAPTIGTATAGNASAVVTFTAPSSNGGNAITSYTVTSSPGGITATGASSPITVTGLTNDVAYTFTVKATNSQGDSAASSASNSATPALPQAPGQVTGLVATGFNQQVLLGWDAPSSGGTPTDYIIEYKLSSEPTTWTTFNDGTSTTKKAIVTGLSNASAYDFRVKGSNDGNPGTVSATVSATPDDISNLSFVITGESNSGGIGLNSAATAGEIASRSAVQILELTSGNFLFENLDIGTNNLRDHAGLGGYYDCCHGLELGLANSTEANAFPDNAQVYLIKTGQGGSQVSQWNYAGAYFTKFLQRTAAAKTQIPSDRKWVVWMSIGINDGISGTNINSFKTDLTTYIDNIKADLPGAIIIMTQFQSMPASSGYPTINTALADVAALEPNVYVVDTTTATGTDGANHWTYAGLKTVASLMTTTTKSVLGLNTPGLVTSLAATPSSSTVGLTWVAPVGNGGSAITDYTIEYKTSAASSWTTFNDGTSTTASTTVTGLSGGTAYNFRVKAVNASGSGNYSTVNSTTTDGTAPVISSVSSTTTTTTATITWTTDEAGSSIIQYGLTNSYGSSTAEADTSPRVTSHSVTLTGLIACTTYNYRVKSNDAASNLATGSNLTFTTLCTGSSSVTAENQNSITTAGGGSVTLVTGSYTIGLTIPAGATNADAIFQIKQLDKTTAFATTGTPTGVTSVGDHLYDFKSLTDATTTVTSFNDSITITLSYTDSDVVGLNESSLVIYSYDGASWSALTGCVINTSSNTITCTTTHFSLFSLFGSTATASGGGGLPSGAFNAPIVPTNGFKILINKGAKSTASNNVTLSFNAGSDVVNMAISSSLDFSGVGQEKYSSTKTWDLCTTNGVPSLTGCELGTKTVYAKFYTAYGQPSSVIQASIDYLTSTKSSTGSTIKETIPTGSAHAVGVNIRNLDGTVYTITPDGTRRPYTSAAAFLSYGFNTFKNVLLATTGDLSLPMGSFIAPRDGFVVCSDHGLDKGTCYLITEGKRAPFTSAKVFTDLGFTFNKSSKGDVSFMELAPNISSSTISHPAGVLVKTGKTIYITTKDGLIGIPSMTVLTSWGYKAEDTVLSNEYDKLLPQIKVLETRSAGDLK